MQEPARKMPDATQKTYSMTGGPKGLPLLGMIVEARRNPIGMMVQNSLRYGDIIPFQMMGVKAIQLNHPDLIRHVLVDNHKNYYKSDIYLRFEPALGQGLLTSNGEKWRRDRQKIQPMFKREQIEGYYFDVINGVTEKFKKRWLALTKEGNAQINITSEMAAITIEIILKTLFGKDNLDDETIHALHRAYSVLIEHLKHIRLLPKVDFRAMFNTPSHRVFAKELHFIEGVLSRLLQRYKSGELSDKYNMLALLIEAGKEDPEFFTEKTIRDQSLGMVFAGFETTSVVMQWMWYVLDSKPDIIDRLRTEITQQAPCTMTMDSAGLTYEEINRMDYLSAVFKETMRFYPPFWATGRKPVEGDYLGDYKIERGSEIVLPQIVMHRHPRFWEEPDDFIPDRFLPENEPKIDLGLYFPFSQGPRKCSGYKFAEMEAKTVFAKLLPLFDIKILNRLGNALDPGISLKLKHSLQAEIRRI